MITQWIVIAFVVVGLALVHLRRQAGMTVRQLSEASPQLREIGIDALLQHVRLTHFSPFARSGAMIRLIDPRNPDA